MYKQYPSSYQQHSLQSHPTPIFIKQAGLSSNSSKGRTIVKKMSLKKNNAKSYKHPTNQSTYFSYNCRTPRTQTNFLQSQLESVQHCHSEMQKLTGKEEERKRSYNKNTEAGNIVYHMRNKTDIRSTTQILQEANNMQRILPSQRSNLESSRKSTSRETLLFLQRMKQSVVSYTQSDQYTLKLQESQILLDYFHPTEGQLSSINNILQEQDLAIVTQVLNE